MDQSCTPSKYVLLIDDEQHQTRMLCMLLETRGYDVQTAFSANEAFKKISPDVDLVILDLALPDIDGFEVCRLIKQNETLRHIPVIVLSAYSLREDRLKSFYLGADDFLAKPCEHEELFARMEAILRRRHNMDMLADGGTTIVELRRILDEGAITTFYQPIYQLNPVELFGFEVLTRPISQGSLENPEKFFKMALQFGLYPDIELMSWAQALKTISEVKYTGKIFLNCNPYFIESPQFARVRALMEQYRIKPEQVVLEITERSAIPDYQLFFEKLKVYHDCGFNFAVDDLGSGYASLESIVEIRPNFIKVDGHIVRDLYRDDFKRSIIESVANFSKRHHIKVVAEGIEDQRDLDTARQLGIETGQGYFFCRPQGTLDVKTFQDIAKSSKFKPTSNSYHI